MMGIDNFTKKQKTIVGTVLVVIVLVLVTVGIGMSIPTGNIAFLLF